MCQNRMECYFGLTQCMEPTLLKYFFLLITNFEFLFNSFRHRSGLIRVYLIYTQFCLKNQCLLHIFCRCALDLICPMCACVCLCNKMRRYSFRLRFLILLFYKNRLKLLHSTCGHFRETNIKIFGKIWSFTTNASTHLIFCHQSEAPVVVLEFITSIKHTKLIKLWNFLIN